MTEREELLFLREELDALRLANAALEQQMLAGAEQTDAMLRQVEKQRNALREAGQRERSLLGFVQRVMDTVNSLVVVLGVDGRIRQANRHCLQQLGMTEQELLGCVLDERLHPVERAALDAGLPRLPWTVHSALFETVRRQGGYHGEHRLLSADGSYRHFLLNATLLFSTQGKEEGAVVDAADITPLKEQELRLRASEASLNEAQRVARLGSWELDLISNELTWSPEVFRIFEIDSGRFGASYEAFLAIIHPDDRAMVDHAYTNSLLRRESYDIEHRLLFGDRRVKWVNERCVNYYAEDGAPVRSIGTVQDITERKLAEEQLRLAASVFDNSLNGILIARPDGTICKVNRAFSEITGYDAEEAVGKTPRLVRSGHHDRAFYNNLWGTLGRDGKWEGEIWNRRKDGQVIPVWQSISAVKDAEGTITHYIGIFSDITEQKASAERIHRLAHYDVLTGLPNRALLLDRGEQILARAKREKRRFAVFFLDLDRFKQVNDGLGHPTGDALLQAVAKRLQQSLREQDTVARLGGDEFVILLEDIESNDDVGRVAEKLVAAIAAPFSVQTHELSVGTTIGISLYPDHGEDMTTLIKHADLALYQAKEHGRGCFRFFAAQFTEQATERMQLENDLRHALERHELRLEYQPLYNLADGRLTGLEALLRWDHPARGTLSPAAFISLAEDSGLIVPIGAWVLEEACRQAMQWRGAGFELHTMAVNLSGVQLQRGDILETVTRVLERTGLPPRCLELEIAETYVMRHAARDMHMLESLHALGVALAIDDFGTGQSSLNYLKRLPVSKLKIDRSFVEDIDHNIVGETITRAILGLGRGLEMTVVAEGVETVEQERFLRGINCDQVQGFLYSRPLTPAACEALLAAGQDALHAPADAASDHDPPRSMAT